MGLAAADEDRSAAIAVASRAAALLAAELLAGAGNVAALAGAAGGGPALLELPGDDPVEDVGTRLDGENLVVELDVAARLAASRVWTLTFILRFLAFVAARSGLIALGRIGFLVIRGLRGVVGVSLGSVLGLCLGDRAGFLLGRDRRDFVSAGQCRNFVDGRIVDQARRGRFARSACPWSGGRPDKARCRAAAA